MQLALGGGAAACRLAVQRECKPRPRRVMRKESSTAGTPARDESLSAARASLSPPTSSSGRFEGVDSSWALLKRSARLVADVLYFSGVSVALAALLALLVSRSDVFLPPSSRHSHAAFLQVLQAITCVSHSFAVVVMKVVEMRVLHHTDYPEQRLTVLWSLLQLSSHGMAVAFVITLGAVVAATYGAECLQICHPRAIPFKLHFHISCVVNAAFRAAVSVAGRRIYYHRTLEGRNRGGSSVRPLPSNLVLFLRAYKRVTIHASMVYLAASVIHASTYIHLETHQDTLLFSFATQGLKAVVLATTKRLLLRKSSVLIHERRMIKVVYAFTAAPTILIHTHARLILMHTQLSLSVYGIMVFAVLEPTMRIARVEWAHHEIRQRLKQSKVAIVPSAQYQVPLRSDRLMLSRGRRVAPSICVPVQDDAFLVWKRSLLLFHAAESYADMCSEYIAIGCSTTMYFLFSTSPCFFRWSDTEAAVQGAATQTTGSLAFAVLQLLLEMTTDLLCSIWELKRGIPLETPSDLRGFLMGLYASTALITVMISASMYVRSSE